MLQICLSHSFVIDYFNFRFVEVAACHYSHLSAAMTATGKVNCIIRLPEMST